MESKGLNNILGGGLIIAGTTLGAGVLAIPITSAHLGFTTSALLMLTTCLIMGYAALLMIEIDVHLGEGLNISTASGKILGDWGRKLASFAMILLHYALLAAYASGGASLLKTVLTSQGLNLDTIWLQTGFTLILALFILIATKAVDYLNRCLFAFKIIFFIILLGVLLPLVNTTNLTSTSATFIPLYAAIPVFVTAFGYHGSIHSVVEYIGAEHSKRLIAAFIFGSLVAFSFYVIWQFVAIGALPLFGEISFETVFRNKNDVGTFISQLNQLNPGNTINWASNGFSLVAIATSFLGVGLGLFDFFLQKTRASNNFFGRIKSGLWTFIIPLIFAIYYPQGFIFALGFAGVALTIIAIILPTLMILKLRKSKEYCPKYKAPGGNLPIKCLFLAGLGIIACEVIGWFQ